MITKGKEQEFRKQKKKKLGRTDEINILFEKYITMKSKLINIGRLRNDIIELKFKCLI